MKIIARETRPLSERIIVVGPLDRATGERILSDLNEDPRVTLVLGRSYRLVEDDYKLIDRLDLLTKH